MSDKQENKPSYNPDIDHKIYKKATPEDADAECFVFPNENNFEKYYYKHPELEKDEVRLIILSTGLCQTDVHHSRQHWGDVLYPCCPGHEIIGEVTDVGSEVKEYKKGDKVAAGPFRDSCEECVTCKEGHNNCCIVKPFNFETNIYGKKFGGYSTHLQIKASHVYVIPDNLDLKRIAPIMCAGITTFAPLYKHCKKGQRVAVLGFGGLGHFATQWASKMGCQVDVFSTSHKKDDMIKKYGGDKIYCTKDNEHKDLSNTYNVMINTIPANVSKEQLNEFLDCLLPYGTFIQVGLGNINKHMLNIDPFPVVLKNLNVVGHLVGSRQDYKDMFAFAKEHGIECECEVYEWEDFPKALEKLEHGRPLMRCVVNVEPVSRKYVKQ